jgi:hypothetical protein
MTEKPNKHHTKTMKKLTQMLALAAVAALCLSTANLFAQDSQGGSGSQGGTNGNRGGRGGRGNWDPAQMQQRMLDGIRERLDVTDDAEWKAMEPLVTKVFEARRDQMMSGMRMAVGRGRGGDQGNRPRFGPEPSAEETALSDAIEKNAGKDELKAKMAALRKYRAQKEAELKAAQDDLKKVLTTKQEAVALEMGLIS